MTLSRGLLVWDERFLDYRFGPAHPFTEASRRSAVQLLESTLPERAAIDRLREVPEASRAYLSTFHEPEYLDLVRRASERDRAIVLDAGDTPSFPGCWAASARLAEGAARAVDHALAHHAPAFHPAGGLHHAHPDRASGFCIFNDVALAVGRAVEAGHKVAYLDVDAHHGDGVMYGFYRSGRVLDIDFHQDGRTLFPGTGAATETGAGDGAGWKVNVPLPPGAGDQALTSLFDRIVPTMLRSFRPDLIIVQHGADGHAGDPLTQLQYTSRSFDRVDRQMTELASELCGHRLVVTGGGGYRAESVARVLARAGMAVLTGAAPPLGDPLPEAWRRSFEEEWHRPAPPTWSDPAIPPARDWSPEMGEKLLGTLESELGVRFPATGTD